MDQAKPQTDQLGAATPARRSYFEKFIPAYHTAALLTFNTLLLGLFAGAIYFGVSRLAYHETPEPPKTPVEKYGEQKVLAVHPHRCPEETKLLLKETWSRPLIFEPYTQFAEAPFRGKYVNVADAGFRLVEDQGPWPPARENFNVFVFGGSTTFGYGVADAETIPAALQRKLKNFSPRRVCVYNFGRAHYYSTQERVLFANLLAADVVPAAAVFIDGLNDFYFHENAPEYSADFIAFLNRRLFERKKLTEEWPSVVLQPLPGEPKPGASESECATALCQRYLRNRTLLDALCRAYGVQVVFVWQPVPTYKYDLKYHPFQAGLREHQFTAVGYQTMARLRQLQAPHPNELWLADLQENATEPLYIDAVHYSPKMCEKIAAELDQFARHHWQTKAPP